MTFVRTNRPWSSTFDHAIEAAKPTSRGLDQVYKLARNFIASLDTGSSPNMRLVNAIDSNVKLEGMSGKDRYLLWVKTWKHFYKRLSELIRHYKQFNRPELLRLKETAQVMLNARHVGKLASWAIVQRTKRLNAT